jgi:hypothetical protein
MIAWWVFFIGTTWVAKPNFAASFLTGSALS